MEQVNFKRKRYNLTAFNLMLLVVVIFGFSPLVQGQVTIGIGKEPDKGAILDLKENEDGSSKKGLLLPRVALVSLDLASPLPEHIPGMYVYNTTREGDLVPGNYFNDGFKWIRVKDITSEPWLNSETALGAEKVEENIYHTGTVAMGTVTTDASAQVEIASNSKGLLIPRLSRLERNGIANPANGLLIFNTTTNCLNYYEGQVKKWLSLCGTYDPAQFDLLNCNNPTGPKGTFTEGAALNTSNVYTLVINVTEIGTYDIAITTINGYTFSKSGVFTSTGTYEIELGGQGAPIKEGADAVTLIFNNSIITPNCTLPPVTVNPASIRLTVNCSATKVYGEYITRVSLNSSNYVEVEVNVTSAGETVIETLYENGIKFSSGSISLSTGSQKVKLYGQGTPIAAGIFTRNAFTIDNATCTPTIEVKSSTGTFDFPANRCQEILDENPSARDGYYWVKEAGGNKFKTYCDMEPDGAWTLIKSLSERQILVTEKTQNESFATQRSRNPVTSREGKFNEYAFSLSAATVNNIGNSVSSERKIRFTIKEQGHTTTSDATYLDIESSTVSPNEDIWTQDNYWIVTMYSGNPSTGNYTSSNNITEGKLFGRSWGKPDANSSAYYFEGVRFAGTPPGMYSYNDFFTGFYGGLGYVAGNSSANNRTYTYHDRTDGNNGKTYTFNLYYINDLYGLYMNSENQLNHHIGTCANSTDDFGGASYCNAGWSNWRPHNFNRRPDGNYEGRIVQYWVK
ncbi:hypothetical protein JGH11_09525 [Dysgonomonas sp. Marseille-P4677]|uniref:fibrinogen-like YCDxxxxGGGW domain-containing protein n=1 Tax=Dysgonomonas sp. Marseille-P4677 TaxID=2364790 RepID=UPI001914477B|nr:fibrinogen-like YCDxxxxGGGW domain-containing protein [Dysgonomonas sp. Marseille-P4677]MBK5721106.1 hypothetical protein [Dysgonomonas sp. Marseille-P4677]